MAHRSITGTPDNDLDHAEWQNGPEDEYLIEDARGRELGAAEMAAEVMRILGPALDRIRKAEDEQMGAAMAVRFEDKVSE